VIKFGGQKEDVAWMQKAEKWAFRRADVIVLPNQHVVPIYSSLLPSDQRIEYLTSGCKEPIVRHVLPLDPANFYFLYLGRRMEIKGFDVVLEAFQRAQNEDPRLRLIVVGSGKPLSLTGVIDVGFSTEPASWMASCDYFLSANRQSYLDLSLLEALSTGTPSIVCCTGGHRQFRETESKGVYSIGAPEAGSLARAMLDCRRKRADNVDAEAGNRKLFCDLFSADQYRIRLDKFLAQGDTSAASGTHRKIPIAERQKNK
jgi:glycosyltransferase involved in cell wall biosynthesis